MKYFVYETETMVPGTLEEVFGFFCDAGNLELITPPWLNFRIVTPLPIDIREGAVIDYRLRLYGVPIRWRTLIEGWDPPQAFVDRALKSPYRLWRHTHSFEERAGGVWMQDRVEYAPPLALVTLPFVRREVEKIFEYRRETIRGIFGGAESAEVGEGVPAGAV